MLACIEIKMASPSDTQDEIVLEAKLAQIPRLAFATIFNGQRVLALSQTREAIQLINALNVRIGPDTFENFLLVTVGDPARDYEAISKPLKRFCVSHRRFVEQLLRMQETPIDIYTPLARARLSGVAFAEKGSTAGEEAVFVYVRNMFDNMLEFAVWCETVSNLQKLINAYNYRNPTRNYRTPFNIRRSLIKIVHLLAHSSTMLHQQRELQESQEIYIKLMRSVDDFTTALSYVALKVVRQHASYVAVTVADKLKETFRAFERLEGKRPAVQSSSSSPPPLPPAPPSETYTYTSAIAAASKKKK